MEFFDLFLGAKRTIVIVGTNPLIPHLERSGRFFADLMSLNTELELTILYESDSENFAQSLCLDISDSQTRVSYSVLAQHKERISGTERGGGLVAQIAGAIKVDETRENVLGRIRVRQANLRLPLCMIQVDDAIRFCAVTQVMPDHGSYLLAEGDIAQRLSEFIDFYTHPKRGGIYLSKPGQELIQMYDGDGYPRGIYPRACFYTTAFQTLLHLGIHLQSTGGVASSST